MEAIESQNLRVVGELLDRKLGLLRHRRLEYLRDFGFRDKGVLRGDFEGVVGAAAAADAAVERAHHQQQQHHYQQQRYQKSRYSSSSPTISGGFPVIDNGIECDDEEDVDDDEDVASLIATPSSTLRRTRLRSDTAKSADSGVHLRGGSSLSARSGSGNASRNGPSHSISRGGSAKEDAETSGPETPTVNGLKVFL